MPQIVFALQQAEGSTPVAGICCMMGVAEQTFCTWKRRYGGLGMSETRRLRQMAGITVYQQKWERHESSLHQLRARRRG